MFKENAGLLTSTGAARMAGGTPPTSPMKRANAIPAIPVSQIIFGTAFPFLSAQAVAKGLREVGLMANDH